MGRVWFRTLDSSRSGTTPYMDSSRSGTTPSSPPTPGDTESSRHVPSNPITLYPGRVARVRPSQPHSTSPRLLTRLHRIAAASAIIPRIPPYSSFFENFSARLSRCLPLAVPFDDSPDLAVEPVPSPNKSSYLDLFPPSALGSLTLFNPSEPPVRKPPTLLHPPLSVINPFWEAPRGPLGEVVPLLFSLMILTPATSLVLS
ncbi:unnamed protein product [Boreogadus saida]